MPSNQIKNYIISLADRLLAHYHINSAENWYWFEDYMTYANNVLPEAMLFSYLVTGEERYKEIALITFDFLLSHYFMKGELKVVSNNGWFKKKNERAFFGEQPIEVVLQKRHSIYFMKLQEIQNTVNKLKWHLAGFWEITT